jgi:hypothetical protein
MYVGSISVVQLVIFFGLVMAFRVASARSFGSWSWPLSILLPFLLLFAPIGWILDLGP